MIKPTQTKFDVEKPPLVWLASRYCIFVKGEEKNAKVFFRRKCLSIFFSFEGKKPGILLDINLFCEF